MKKQIIILLVFGLALICISQVYAAYPKITPYVNDLGNVLTDSQEADLNTMLAQIEKNTTVEIVIITVDNTNGEDRVMYAARVGEENGVGKKTESNGVIILWSKDNERGLAMATGRGIESVLNDAKVGRILRDNRPLFDNGTYYQGFQSIILSVSNEIGADPTNPSGSSGLGDISIVMIVLVILIILVIIIILSGGRSSSFIPIIGGGSSGGSSFGGGSFGGGGSRG